MLIYLLAACVSPVEKKKKSHNPTVLKDLQINHFIVSAFLLVSLILTTACIYYRYPVYQAYKDWRFTKLFYTKNLFPEACKGYEKLEPYLDDQVNFLFEYGRSLSQTGAYMKSNHILEKGIRVSADPMFYNIIGRNYQALKQYKLAEKYFLQAANIIPHRLHSYYLLVQLYMESGDTTKAIKTARMVLEKAPKIESEATEEIREKMREIIERN